MLLIAFKVNAFLARKDIQLRARGNLNLCAACETLRRVAYEVLIQRFEARKHYVKFDAESLRFDVFCMCFQYTALISQRGVCCHVNSSLLNKAININYKNVNTSTNVPQL